MSFTKPKTSEPPDIGKGVRVTFKGVGLLRQESRWLLEPGWVAPALTMYASPMSVVQRGGEIRFM